MNAHGVVAAFILFSYSKLKHYLGFPGLYHFRSWGYIILDLEFIFYKKPTILNLNALLEVIFS